MCRNFRKLSGLRLTASYWPESIPGAVIGGQAPWARQVIAWWGTAGFGLFLWTCLTRRRSTEEKSRQTLRFLWPLLLYDLLVIASCFNPGFREVMVAGQPSLVLADPHPWLPSAARPLLAMKELWQFNGLVVSSFNLLLVLHRRGQVRRVLFLLAGNAVVLAVFGTFQKLAGAKGLWFGLVPSPNPRFFATFIYHNHWGAFTLLNLAAGVALLFHYHRRGGQRDIWHSPVLLGAVAIVLLALSVPLYFLFELSVVLSAVVYRRRVRKQAEHLAEAGDDRVSA